MYAYIYIHLYVYMCVYIYIDIHTYIRINIYYVMLYIVRLCYASSVIRGVSATASWPSTRRATTAQHALHCIKPT